MTQKKLVEQEREQGNGHVCVNVWRLGLPAGRNTMAQHPLGHLLNQVPPPTTLQAMVWRAVEYIVYIYGTKKC